MKRVLYHFTQAILLAYLAFVILLFVSSADWTKTLLNTLGDLWALTFLFALLGLEVLISHVPSKRDTLHFFREQAKNLMSISDIPLQRGDTLLFVGTQQEPKYGFDLPLTLDGAYLFATNGLLERLTKEHLEQYLQLYRSVVAQELTQQDQVQLTIVQKRWLCVKVRSFVYGRVTVYSPPTARPVKTFFAPYLHGKITGGWYY